MIHPLILVADSHYLDVERFTKFATEQHPEMLVHDDSVSTWHVNELVSAYREHIGSEQDSADRLRLIQEKMARRLDN